MAEVDSRQVKLRVVGTADLNRKVRASVFASKLASLVKAMEAADKSANGETTYDFVIADLKPSSASATIEEQRANKNIPHFSSVDTFGRCIQSVATGRYEYARQHLECARHIAVLAKGAEENFDVAEITVNGFDIVRVDKLFYERAAEAVRIAAEEPTWFKGVTVGSLDGTIVVEDARSGTPTLTLRLTIGGKDIACECSRFSSEELKPFFDNRVRVTGAITYTGNSGLPHKIELYELPRAIKTNPDIQRWEGSFGDAKEERGWHS
ncbi:hypothetical protein NKI95_12110 [Mesorhizobium sp. M0306]|uniref:hypothetical protein n=1 Tax=Mesorhizobium sp. M0306 TaxID=2956932 RepID=UPI003335AD90